MSESPLKELSMTYVFSIAHRTSSRGEIHPHRYRVYINVQPQPEGPTLTDLDRVMAPWLRVFNRALVLWEQDPIIMGGQGIPTLANLDGMNPRWVIMDVNPTLDMFAKHFWDVFTKQFGARLYKVSVVEDEGNVYSFVKGKLQPEQGAPPIVLRGSQVVQPILEEELQWPQISEF